MVSRPRRPTLDSARFGRTPVQFLLVLAACCLVAIVALVIVVAQRGPAPALVGLGLAVLPIPLLLVLILYLDRLIGVMVTDVRMLASLRMRRLGRQWARLNLGVDGKRAMARYQLAATELAMACNRNSFGRTTEEAYARHRDDSLDLMRAAAAIVRRHEQLYQPPWIGPDDPSVFVTPIGPPSPPTWPSRPQSPPRPQS